MREILHIINSLLKDLFKRHLNVVMLRQPIYFKYAGKNKIANTNTTLILSLVKDMSDMNSVVDSRYIDLLTPQQRNHFSSSPQSLSGVVPAIQATLDDINPTIEALLFEVIFSYHKRDFFFAFRQHYHRLMSGLKIKIPSQFSSVFCLNQRNLNN